MFMTYNVSNRDFNLLSTRVTEFNHFLYGCSDFKSCSNIDTPIKANGKSAWGEETVPVRYDAIVQ